MIIIFENPKDILGELEKHGVEVITKPEPVCTDGPEDSVIKNLFDKFTYRGTNITDLIKGLCGEDFKELEEYVESKAN